MLQISGLLNLKTPLILASQSPRRRRLLQQLGFDFTVEPASINENLPEGAKPGKLAKILAYEKASAIAKLHEEPALILGADTIVALDGVILSKPVDEADARRILKTLSGNTHSVFTGIALIETPSGRNISDVQETKVSFRLLDDSEIKSYVASGSPLDKAGAYGIQDDFGAVFVNNIQGCYYNIVGLPLELLYSSMREFLKDN